MVTAERRADRAESGRRGSDEGRDGEADLRGDEPWNNASSGAPEFSWSASDEESPSGKTV